MKQEDNEHLPGCITVWLAQVSQAGDSLAPLESYLDARERERAERFRFPEDRARFVLGRGLLRKSLGRYLDQAPESIEIIQTSRGRPVLKDTDAIQFSLTHSGDWVGIAVTAQGRVGIDLEHVKSNFDPYDLAEKIFSELDLTIFRALPEHEARAAFFQAWTCKEAYLKALGEGITERLRDVSISQTPEEPARLLIDFHNVSASRAWRLHPLPMPSDYLGNLACDSAHKQLDCHWVRLDRGEVILDV